VATKPQGSGAINICSVFQPNGENSLHVVTAKIYDFLEASFIGAKIILFHFIKNVGLYSNHI